MRLIVLLLLAFVISGCNQRVNTKGEPANHTTEKEDKTTINNGETDSSDTQKCVQAGLPNDSIASRGIKMLRNLYENYESLKYNIGYVPQEDIVNVLKEEILKMI